MYTLPPCYRLAAGTSSATPHAAGAGALLISAAKQVGIPHDAARLAWALRTGARPLSAYGVHEQGGGLIDVRRAWDLLHSHIDVPEIRVDAPVRTLLNPYLRRPGRGRGLYEREGWAPGDTGTRTITLTRTSGRAGAVTYGLRWRGDDGTFTTPARSVNLPLDTPVDVSVRLAPATAGVHSAALEVVDRASGVAVRQVLATVVAAHQLTAAGGYALRLRGRAQWPRPIRFFVNVPQGAAALRVEMQGRAGRLGLLHEDPATLSNLTWEGYFKGYRYPLAGYISVTPGSSGVELIPQPLAGVWELTASPIADPTFGGDSAQYRVHGDVELVVSALGATGTSVLDTLAFTNRLAGLGGARVVPEVGVRRVETGSVDSAAAGPTFDLHVDSGTTSLRLAVEPTDSSAQLDLYLFDCTTGPCYLWDVNFIHQRRAELLVRAPRQGAWKAVIDPARVPGVRTGFTYTEIMTNARYGTVASDTACGALATGAQWKVPAEVRPGIAIPSGRERVVVADLIDQASEAEEQVHPLAAFGGAPYRPAVVASAVSRVFR